MQVCFDSGRKRPKPAVCLIYGLLLALLPGWHAAPARAADPDILWKIVHDRCVPAQQRFHDPSPCEQVDSTGGYALLKDIVGQSQFLLIPTIRVSGIEDPQLLAPDAANYFARAWENRALVGKRLGQDLPRGAISLAINSVSGRSQNQLHIHIDCIRGDVRDALHAHLDQISQVWARFPGGLRRHAYWAMRIENSTLGAINPFRLLAGGLPGAKQEMGRFTLVLAGATFADGKAGFILLADRADPAALDRASGEELQDHACALAHAR